MSYAKILPPELPAILERTRLFALLDQQCNRQAIWIQGPAGAGKTTLVASYVQKRGEHALWYRIDNNDKDPATFFHYFSLAAENLQPTQHRPLPQLTPESLARLELFCSLYCRELFHSLPKPLLLVFDNVPNLTTDSPLLEMITVILTEVPRETRVILISRCPPPASLSRMQLNRTLGVLGQDSLRLTDEEVSGLVRLWWPEEVQAETITRMNECIDGWIAGLVLLIERGGFDGVNAKISDDYFFDYFATQIFDTLGKDLQRFLLQTANFTNMPLSVIEELTGVSGARLILEKLCERHYFTTKSEQSEPEYQYHPLFREFLLTRARQDLGPKSFQQISVKSAQILARAGKMEEAINMAMSASDWALASTFINRHAPAMLRQQRFQLLEGWLQKIPKAVSASSPWLSYWYGCCRRPFQQQASLDHFTIAYTGFKKQQQHDGMLLSASGAILSIITEWDDFRPLDKWILALEELIDNPAMHISGNEEATLALAMFGALLFHQPQHAAMPYWEERARQLIRENGLDLSLRIEIGNILVHWQYWRGDLAAATHTADFLTQLIELGGSATLPHLSSVMNHAIHDWHTAEFDHCLESINKGLLLSAEMGIQIMDDRLMAQSVYASLSRDDLPTARQFLDRMKPILQYGRRLSVSHYHYLFGNYHLAAGDLEIARYHIHIAVDINSEIGAPYPEALASITLAQIDFEKGDAAAATKLLAKAGAMAKAMRSRTLELLGELASAWCKLETQETAALSHLRSALVLQRQIGFLNIPGWRSKIMKPLLLKALENDIEPAFVQLLIRKHNLAADAPTQASKMWPWPVKIYTLGHFSLLINDQPLQFSGKAQQKPLELMKVLISLGGREVGKNRLTDYLWPDTEGDKAYRALDTTLHRLRKLVGYEQVILVQDRKLSLNSQLCWLDSWALEKLLEESEALVRHATHDVEQTAKLKQQLFSLYKGDFLSHDDEPDCIITFRNRLHDRFLQRLSLLGSYFEKQEDWHQAVALYQHILEIDDRQEHIYQQLLLCYRNMGRITKAIEIYGRCRKALATYYGISPSLEMETLFRSLC